MGAGGEREAGVEFDDERGSFAGGGFGPLLDPCRCFSNISTIPRGIAYLQEALRSTLGHTTTALETSSRHYTIPSALFLSPLIWETLPHTVSHL